MLRSHIEGSISLADLAESTSKRQRVADSDVSTRADSSQTPAAASSERPLHDAACAPAGASADTKQSKSLVQEMAAEIARIAQTRVVHVENVRFTCLSTSLQLVKTTCGLAWLLNDRFMFDHDSWELVIRSFFTSVTQDAVYIDWQSPAVLFFDLPVMSISKYWSDNNPGQEDILRFRALLKTPPVLVE
jgi:hypothetical protein